MKHSYVEIPLRDATLEMIKIINKIVDGYSRKNLRMTVRQLYYQLVAKDQIENTVKSYKRIVKLVTDGRLAGLIDWDAIEDRARSFITRTRWDSAQQIIDASANGFHQDMWANQEERPFVLIEKEALSGVLADVCYRYDVPLLACKGYPSATVLREFALNDILPALDGDQTAVILHLGDHDPSGIDMTRDIDERVELFCDGRSITMARLALNMLQIERLKPPPNPAKQTDSRFGAYVRKFGKRCWELDALDPEELQSIVKRSIVQRIDASRWKKRTKQIENIRDRIRAHAATFE